MRNIGLLKCIVLCRKYPTMNVPQREVLRNSRLRELVMWAKENSAFYKELYEDVGSDFQLTDLPPVNKVQLMADFDSWVTDKNVTLDAVSDFTQNKDNIGCRLNGKYLVYTTSGSTGNPSIVIADKTTFSVSAAVSALRSFARKSDLQAFMKRGKKTAGLFAVNGFYMASGSMMYNQKRMPWRKNQLAIDVLAPVNDIVNALNEFQPAMLGSYPSTLELLMSEQIAGRLHISPVLIMLGGEYLRDDLRMDLSKAFNCHVQTHYSCTEAGVIACECEHGRLHINEDWCIVEAVDEKNQPVPNGTQSHKVLITNLANHTQPFIRYELNDRIIIHDEPCGCGKAFRWLEIEGRIDEVLDFGNEVRVAPMALFALLKPINEIKRYQIIQRDNNRLEIRLTADDKQSAFEKAKQAVLCYMENTNAQIEIYLSNVEPQVHPNSGKFRAVYRD